VYCAERYASRVKHSYVEQMGPEEEADFRRHLYFYKNGFIRVFSVLDKLGSMMDEWLGLNTGQIKERFTYFTVLREMRRKGRNLQLLYRLDDVKANYREAMNDLRL